MNNKVLFIQYPSLSHLNASFKIANVLKQHGYEVFYFMPRDFFNHVNSNNFHFYASDTFPFGVDADITLARKMKLNYNYFDKLKNKYSLLFYNVRKGELNAAVESIRPNLIIADTFAGTDFLLLYPKIKQRSIKFFYLETMLSSIGNSLYPYINSKLMPNQKLQIRFEQCYRLYEKKAKRLIQKLIYLGQDEYSVIVRKMKENGFPKEYKIEENNFFDVIFSNIPSLVSSPLELEYFTRPLSEKHHYLGLFVDKDRKDMPADDRLQSLISGNKKIVYISFGTVFGEDRATEIFAFMKKVNTLAKQLTDVEFIFSLGKKEWEQKKLDQLSAIHIFSYIPQLWILKKSKLFITHGGLNSVKESLAMNVPVLVYPIDIDQIGNARKVAHKKIGLYGDLKKDSVTEIRDKIVQLLKSTDYKHNMEMMMQCITDKYREDQEIIDLISDYQPII